MVPKMAVLSDRIQDRYVLGAALADHNRDEHQGAWQTLDRASLGVA